MRVLSSFTYLIADSSHDQEVEEKHRDQISHRLDRYTQFAADLQCILNTSSVSIIIPFVETG